MDEAEAAETVRQRIRHGGKIPTDTLIGPKTELERDLIADAGEMVHVHNS